MSSSCVINAKNFIKSYLILAEKKSFKYLHEFCSTFHVSNDITRIQTF